MAMPQALPVLMTVRAPEQGRATPVQLGQLGADIGVPLAYERNVHRSHERQRNKRSRPWSTPGWVVPA